MKFQLYKDRYSLMEKVYHLLINGETIQHIRNVLSYPKRPYELRQDLSRVFGRDSIQDIEKLKHLALMHKNKEFFITYPARKIYCKSYGLNIKNIDNYIEHIRENFKQAMSNKRFSQNGKTMIRSEEMIFYLIKNFIVTLRLRLDNIDDHLQDKEEVGLEEILTY